MNSIFSNRIKHAIAQLISYHIFSNIFLDRKLPGELDSGIQIAKAAADTPSCNNLYFPHQNTVPMQAINFVNEMLKPLFDAVDENFKQFQPVNKLAGLLKVRPAHIILAFFILAIIALGTGLFSSVFVAIFGFIYPAYMTFKALKAQDSEQCKEWLTYWIVFGFFTAFSGVLKKTVFFFLSRRTFNVFRILFYVFLFHPSCRGASLIYNKILRSKLRQVTAEIEQEQIHQKQA